MGQLIVLQNQIVSACLLSFECFYIAKNHREIAGLKVPIDVKPSRNCSHISHTLCLHISKKVKKQEWQILDQTTCAVVFPKRWIMFLNIVS